MQASTWAHVLVVGAALLLGGQTAGAQSGGSLDDRIKSQREKLEEIQNKINQHRRKSKELDQEEANILRRLSSLEREISLSQKLLGEMEAREKLLEEKIGALSGSIAHESEMLDHQRRKLAGRVRQIYMHGPDHSWAFLLGGAGIQEALRRFKFLRMIAERDARLIEEVGGRKLSLEHEKAVLTEALSEISAVKSARQEENEKLAGSRKDRVAMLKRIQSEKTKHEQAIDELKRSQEKLKDLIGELERKRLERKDSVGLPTTDFATLKGRLLWPVTGKVVKNYGQERHPKFGTVTFNNGIDIQAPAGTPIRAVSAGKVEFVDWISGYGNCIIINHGGGYYTLYAHNAEIYAKPGQSVGAGEVIAEVGESGSLEGYGCHFEIRKSKQALNPIEWLAK